MHGGRQGGIPAVCGIRESVNGICESVNGICCGAYGEKNNLPCPAIDLTWGIAVIKILSMPHFLDFLYEIPEKCHYFIRKLLQTGQREEKYSVYAPEDMVKAKMIEQKRKNRFIFVK